MQQQKQRKNAQKKLRKKLALNLPTATLLNSSTLFLAVSSMEIPKFNELLTTKRIAFILLFTILAFIAAQINFSQILGTENQTFTLFQFFGPTAGAFLGPVFGVISVLLAESINFLLLGKAFEPLNILRLTPMLFAAFYFGTYAKKNYAAVVPLVCMVAFWLHPVGSQVWFYPLYWLIPIVSHVFFSKMLFARSLGATFTAHSIGSVLFLYTIPTEAGLWATLVPIVAFERLMFAAGIAVSFLAFNYLLSKLPSKLTAGSLNIDTNYLLAKN